MTEKSIQEKIDYLLNEFDASPLRGLPPEIADIILDAWTAAKTTPALWHDRELRTQEDALIKSAAMDTYTILDALVIILGKAGLFVGD